MNVFFVSSFLVEENLVSGSRNRLQRSFSSFVSLVGFAAKDVVADVQCEKKQKCGGSIQSIENLLQKEI
jgi:hypothetical protein